MRICERRIQSCTRTSMNLSTATDVPEAEMHLWTCRTMIIQWQSTIYLSPFFLRPWIEQDRSSEVLPCMRHKVTFFLISRVVGSIEIDLPPTTPASSRFFATIYSAERIQRLFISNDNRSPKLEQCFHFGGCLPHHELFFRGRWIRAGAATQKEIQIFLDRPKTSARPSDFEKSIAHAFLKAT